MLYRSIKDKGWETEVSVANGASLKPLPMAGGDKGGTRRAAHVETMPGAGRRGSVVFGENVAVGSSDMSELKRRAGQGF